MTRGTSDTDIQHSDRARRKESFVFQHRLPGTEDDVRAAIQVSPTCSLYLHVPTQQQVATAQPTVARLTRPTRHNHTQLDTSLE